MKVSGAQKTFNPIERTKNNTFFLNVNVKVKHVHIYGIEKNPTWPKFRTGLNNTGCSLSGMGDLKYADNLTESRDLSFAYGTATLVKPSVGSLCESNPDAEIIF